MKLHVSRVQKLKVWKKSFFFSVGIIKSASYSFPPSVCLCKVLEVQVLEPVPSATAKMQN